MSPQEKGWIPQPLYGKILDKIPIPCVDLLIVYKDKLLLMLRNNEPGKDLWFTPGGRILKNESLDDAVQRVLYKETGLKSLDIHQVATMCHIWPEVHTVTTYYSVNVDQGNVSPNDEHRDSKWITEITDDLHPYLVEMIKTAKIWP